MNPPNYDAINQAINEINRTAAQLGQERGVNLAVLPNIAPPVANTPQVATPPVNTPQAATPAVNTPNNNLFSSSDSSVNQERSIINNVNSLSAVNPSIQSVTDASAKSDKIYKDYSNFLTQSGNDEVNAINSQFLDLLKQTQDKQNKETATTAVGLQRIGGYLGNSASSIGALNNLEQAHNIEIAGLEQKRQVAVSAAKNAVRTQQYKLAQEMAQNAVDLEKEINNRKNKFFDQALNLVQEQRQQGQTDFTQGINTIEHIAPTIVEDIQSMTPEQATNYVRAAAFDLRLDPNLLFGEVSKLVGVKRDKETANVFTLAAKYPSAGIQRSDTFETASQKIRNSPEYKNDRAKAEIDLANASAIYNNRSSDESAINNPLITAYTKLTGQVVSNPNEARAIINYADGILAAQKKYEIVSDSYKGELRDYQIKQEDADKIREEAFKSLKKAREVPAMTRPEMNVWISQNNDKSPQEISQFIRQQGYNPASFGLLFY